MEEYLLTLKEGGKVLTDQTPSKRNTVKEKKQQHTLSQIKFKLLKTNDDYKILNAVREKNKPYVQGNNMNKG